jgi:hypothetical protein
MDGSRSHDGPPTAQALVASARRATIDYFPIMAITGHKTLRALQRYNLIDEGDLQDAMATLQTFLSHHALDTSTDTSTSAPLMPRRQSAVNPGS